MYVIVDLNLASTKSRETINDYDINQSINQSIHLSVNQSIVCTLGAHGLLVKSELKVRSKYVGFKNSIGKMKVQKAIK